MTTLVDSTSHVLPRNLPGGTLRKESRGSWRLSESRTRVYRPMKPFAGWTRVAVMGMLLLQLCVVAFAQEEKQDLGVNTKSSPTGQTGAGAESTGMAAAKSGKADGTGNPRLGGERRPPYRLNRNDVVGMRFKLSPQIDQ